MKIKFNKQYMEIFSLNHVNYDYFWEFSSSACNYIWGYVWLPVEFSIKRPIKDFFINNLREKYENKIQ